MIAIDTNILVYAYRSESVFHRQAYRALVDLMSKGTSWAVPWPCVYEFFAVVTNPKIFKTASSSGDAVFFFEGFAQTAAFEFLCEKESGWANFKEIVQRTGITSGKVHDAKIASVCLQNDVHELWTNDRDFSLFPALTTVNPLSQ